MFILQNLDAWVAYHRELMTLFEITIYVIAWATVIAFLFRIGRWTLLLLKPELSHSIELELTHIQKRSARNRVRRLLQRLDVARARHHHLRDYIVGWGNVIIWLLIAMFSTILLCAIVTTYQVLRPHLMHNKIFFIFSSPLLVVIAFASVTVTLRLLNGLVEAACFDVSVDKTLKRIQAILSLHISESDVESLISEVSREYCKAEPADGSKSDDNHPSPPQPPS
jgi:hypothetical protein